MTHVEYVRLLKPLLPQRAFEPVPGKLIPAGVHIMIIVAGWLSFRFVRPVYWPILTIVIGHSLACLAFLAHELSHRSIIRDSKTIRGLELLFWSLNFFPPTLWDKLHNESHHARPNTLLAADEAAAGKGRSSRRRRDGGSRSPVPSTREIAGDGGVRGNIFPAQRAEI